MFFELFWRPSFHVEPTLGRCLLTGLRWACCRIGGALGAETPNPSLFIFGDDPMEEDMYFSSNTIDASDKFGKATGKPIDHNYLR